MRTRSGLSLTWSLALLCLLAFCGNAIAAERPNILLVLMDDVGLGDIRTYNANGKVSLPAIERLAEEGVRFTDAHTSAAKCAPTRYSIITGNYQWRGRKDWGQWNYKGGSQILAGQESLGEVLQRAGYVTAMVGKHHLGAEFYKKDSAQFATGSDLDTAVDFERAMADGPAQHGFDYSFVAMRGVQEGPYAFFEDGVLYGRTSDLISWSPGDYGDTAIAYAGIGLRNWVTQDVGPTLLAKSLDFIETHQRTQESTGAAQPFFLYLNTEAVHDPRKPPVSIGGRYVMGNSGIGERGDMLVEIDAMVEQLQAKLEQLGLLDDTLIILTSDNGATILYDETQAGHDAVGPFRGYKGTIYEGGHRVPLILKWGRQAFGGSPLAPGSVSKALVGTQDLMATLADLVGMPLAADQARDSESFLPILMGRATTVRDQIISEADQPDKYSSDGGIDGRHFAYRSGNWKLIFDSARRPVELYDLSVDPYEKSNLVSQSEHAARVATMKAALETSLKSERTAPLMTEPELVSVPNVVGLTQAAATTAITNARLVVNTVTQQSSATVPAGSVISQNPTAGKSVADGSPVSLVVSTGAAPVSVPNVVGLTQAAATQALTNASLLVGTVTQQSSASVPAGRVISQSPTAGASVADGSTVSLVVSTGAALVSVPNVVGLTQAAATQALTSVNLVVGTVTQQSSATVPAGRVISQNPAAGTSVADGSAVTLVVSTGAAPVSVPNVVGLTQAAATQALTNVNLLVGTVTQQSSATVPAGRVISQSPTAGTSVADGSLVALVVSTGPVPTPPPTVSLVPNPAVLEAGASGSLEWSSTDATSCTASGGWAGARAPGPGAEAIGPLFATTNFTLACSGPGGTTSSVATIVVTAPPPALPIVAISASPASIVAGESSTLAWSSANASACMATGGWDGARAASGSEATRPLSETTSFTLTCSGPGGTGSNTVTVAATLPPAPTVSLSANPASIAAGASATLTWTSTHATTCKSSDGWSSTSAASGSATIAALSVTTAFTITCTGPGGSGSQSVTVSVTAPPPPAPPAPESGGGGATDFALLLLMLGAGVRFSRKI